MDGNPIQAYRVNETDYLVIGAGAGGMCFADQLLEHSDASVTIVDRRDSPGGHWRDAYPFVHLHQPSEFYGISSMPLGSNQIDQAGTNAGMYELAGRDEICSHFEAAMQRRFLPSGRVQYFPNATYLGDGRIVSTISGHQHDFTVRKKVVDATYMEGTFPATDKPPFPIAPGVRWLPAGEISGLTAPPERFMIMGAGKTALDVCVWLLERGVDPNRIEWIRPRDSWWLNRRFHQPATLLPDFYLGSAMQIEAFALSADVADVCVRLETSGLFLRIDPEVWPSMFRAAITSEAEIEMLRRIQKVHRLGHITAIEDDRIVLEHGTLPTGPEVLHVHCAASALARRPLKPIFEPGLITIQPLFYGFACLQFATLGAVEALLESDEEKNALCPPIQYWDTDADFVRTFLALLLFDRQRANYPTLEAWARSTRLNPFSGVSQHSGDPRMVEARDRIKQVAADVAPNAIRMLAATSH